MALLLLTKEHQYHWTNSKHKEAKVSILTSNKVDFKTNSMAKDKEIYFIMIKESIYKEGITTIMCMYLITKIQNTWIKSQHNSMKK